MFSCKSDCYCTTTVSVMLWFRLPEVAVTVAVYVPAGVPGDVCEDEPPPPQPSHDAQAKTMIGAARTGRWRRLSILRSPAANKNTVQANPRHSGGNPGYRYETPPVIIGAVVDTITVTGAAVPAVTLIELGKLQFGADVTAGLMAQLRLTAPLNEPDGVTAKLKVALCPALTV